MQYQDISQSTRHRYRQANRQHELGTFANFKTEYKNYFKADKIEQIKTVYSHGLCGRNQQKYMVIADKIGSIKIQELSKVLEDEQLVAYFNQRMLNITEEHLAQKDQLIWIIDLSGRIMQLASKRILDLVGRIIHNLQTYFPELLRRLVLVNTPMLFDTVWSKLEPMIGEQTREKIVVLEDLDNLGEFADAGILPDFLGGELQEKAFLYGTAKEKEEKESQNQSQQNQSSSEEEVDFSQFKMALSGLAVPGKPLQSVSQTPLNTEADENK